MIYARGMILCIAAFGIPAVAVAGLVVLLNSLDVSPGLAVAAYAVIAVPSGVTIGYFGDRLLERPSKQHSGSACRLRHDH